MPIAKIDLIEGYSDADKARLARAVTNAVRFVVPAPPDAVTVLIDEHAKSEYMRGGQTRTPAPALPDASEVVRAYLGAMEQRDLQAAQSFLSEGFTMHFPNAEPMTALTQLIVWAKDRYSHVSKTYSGIDAYPGEACTVVIARGHLNGAWPDGSAFSGVRFIDRFELVDGQICLQEVWNDLGELRGTT